MCLMEINTERLLLIATTPTHLQIELESPEQLSVALKANVSHHWPPGEYDRDAMAFFKKRLEENPGANAGWYAWYVLHSTDGGNARTLVASAGFFGPPVSGQVEIGYSVLPEWRRRGFATEIVGALVARAFEYQDIDTVIATTAEANIGSKKALARHGFVLGEPTAADSLRFERRRGPSSAAEGRG